MAGRANIWRWISGALAVAVLAGSESFALPPSLKELEAKPEWLFPASECPADVIGSRRQEIRYVADGCRSRPEACLASCRNGDAADCYALGLLLQESDDAAPYAEALFLRSCKLGIDSGCTNRAVDMSARVEREAAPSTADDRCAARTFDKVCERGDPWACTMLGLHLAIGRGVAQDLERALGVLPGGCRLSETDKACTAARELIRAIEQQRSSPPAR